MPVHRMSRLGALVLALCLVGPSIDRAGGAEEGELSEAQMLLFRTPHLDGIDHPVTLDYEYRREEEDGQGFVDTVAMNVTAIASDGGKDVNVKFLSGPREKSFGEFSGFRGNPVIMVFLEDDVQRMGEKFGGGSIYMRNKIRYSFYDGATTEPVSFQLDGRRIDGTKVTVAPFVGDENRARLGAYERKVYEFVVSPDVPGEIYQIRSYVPSASLAGKPVIEDTLTYKGTES